MLAHQRLRVSWAFISTLRARPCKSFSSPVLSYVRHQPEHKPDRKPPRQTRQRNVDPFSNGAASCVVHDPSEGLLYQDVPLAFSVAIGEREDDDDCYLSELDLEDTATEEDKESVYHMEDTCLFNEITELGYNDVPKVEWNLFYKIMRAPRRDPLRKKIIELVRSTPLPMGCERFRYVLYVAMMQKGNNKEQLFLKETLQPLTKQWSLDLYGSEVICRALRYYPGDYKSAVCSVVLSDFHMYIQHPHGAKVVQKLFETCDSEDQLQLAFKYLEKFSVYARDTGLDEMIGSVARYFDSKVLDVLAAAMVKEMEKDFGFDTGGILLGHLLEKASPSSRQQLLDNVVLPGMKKWCAIHSTSVALWKIMNNGTIQQKQSVTRAIRPHWQLMMTDRGPLYLLTFLISNVRRINTTSTPPGKLQNNRTQSTHRQYNTTQQSKRYHDATDVFMEEWIDEIISKIPMVDNWVLSALFKQCNTVQRVKVLRKLARNIDYLTSNKSDSSSFYAALQGILYKCSLEEKAIVLEAAIPYIPKWSMNQSNMAIVDIVLSNATVGFKHDIIEHCLPYIRKMAMNNPGTFAVQRFIRDASDSMKLTILAALEPIDSIADSPNGYAVLRSFLPSRLYPADKVHIERALRWSQGRVMGSVRASEWIEAMAMTLGWDIEDVAFHRYSVVDGQVFVEGEEAKIGEFFVDGYHAKSNTVLEYHGNEFHGWPPGEYPSYVSHTDTNKFGTSYWELYLKTMEKMDYLKSRGCNVFYVFQNAPETFKML